MTLDCGETINWITCPECSVRRPGTELRECKQIHRSRISLAFLSSPKCARRKCWNSVLLNMFVVSRLQHAISFHCWNSTKQQWNGGNWKVEQKKLNRRKIAGKIKKNSTAIIYSANNLNKKLCHVDWISVEWKIIMVPHSLWKQAKKVGKSKCWRRYQPRRYGCGGDSEAWKTQICQRFLSPYIRFTLQGWKKYLAKAKFP